MHNRELVLYLQGCRFQSNNTSAPSYTEVKVTTRSVLAVTYLFSLLALNKVKKT